MGELKLIKENELFYNGYSLKDLAVNYGTPLKITFLDVIKNRVITLKSAFEKAISEKNYNGKFIYLNANKANYGALEILESFKYSDGLETSSFYDLLLTLELFKRNPKFKDKLIVSNGYKPNDYLNTIIECARCKQYKIIDIIDSYDEYERLKQANIELEVGLRIHIPSLYNESEEEPKNDRFGISELEFEKILEDIRNTKLILSTIHFHQRGFDYEEEKFKENFEKVFSKFYVKANKQYNTVCNFDMGGGSPLPTEGSFDYDAWAKLCIELLQEISIKYNVTAPNLISENGKYSQKDSTVNIYKVVTKKYTDEYPWHIVDGSLLIAMPEMYALGEPIEVKPINELDKEMIKARLAGITCDCDDVYYEKGGYILLPKTNEDLYIGLLGTGSYQNSMNGKGGVHHCLLPEEKDIVIYTENNEHKVLVRNELQTIEDIFKLMKM